MKQKKTETAPRTLNIPITLPDDIPDGHSFKLHIESESPLESNKKNLQEQVTTRKPEVPSRRILRREVLGKDGNSLSVRVWNTLEWVATSALIFMVLFFAANYQAYYQLFVSKLDRLRGVVNVNPYIEKILPGGTQQSQQLLPITSTPELNKKQIPALSMSITPPDERVIIPRINQNVPVVGISSENLVKRDWNALEKEIQSALQNGVVHYPGTAQPGQDGNVVITGHSSYFAWDPGRFKDVFALLHEVNIGDSIIMYYNQQKYLYKVYDRLVVMPDQVDVLTQSGENRLTLITCTPVGTNLKRLIILAKPLSN